MSDKAEWAYRTISEVSEQLDVPAHVLRFWETKFTQLRPMKRSGGRRYYKASDMALLCDIRDLLYRDGFTIKGAQKALKEKKGLKDKAAVKEGSVADAPANLAAETNAQMPHGDVSKKADQALAKLQALEARLDALTAQASAKSSS